MSLTSPFEHHHFAVIHHHHRDHISSDDECMLDVRTRKQTNARPTTTATPEADPCVANGRCVQECVGYGRVCLFAAQRAANYTCKEILEMKEGSVVFSDGDNDIDTFPWMRREDISLGDKLGEGGFSSVNACTMTTPSVQRPDGQQYAIKYLKRKAMADPSHFRHGAADLAMEAHFLRVLQHPNIVQLHGVSPGPIKAAIASGQECSFYIVIDRLVETLEQRLERWRKADHRFHYASKHQQQQRLLQTRIEPIALEIAKALDYLHAKRIIFRDLKPDNIGFDANGTLKLFDFGLAKELKPSLLASKSRKSHTEQYKLTGNTGSRRYMAPEVAKGLPYNASVDVYSFGILCWELCTLEKSFAGYSIGKHMQRVVNIGERPPMQTTTIQQSWPLALQRLVVRCWSPFADSRPPFAEVVTLLRGMLPQNDDDNNARDDGSSKRKAQHFGFLSPLSSSRRIRNKTTGSLLDTTKVPLKRPPLLGATRSRSWGFAHKT